jgi:RNA polymerase sigma factor (sigma-70 family)
VSNNENQFLKDEQLLLKECLKNNPKALKCLYELYASKMLGVLIRYAKDKMEAEDMLQEGFIRVFRNLEKFRYEGSLEGWVRRIMINTAINYYKSNLKHNQSVDIDNVSHTAPMSVNAVDTMSYKQLIKLIQTLPEGYRIVFNLYVVEGYSHKEIADHLGISENTSKSQLSRARKVLQKKIENQSLKCNEKSDAK